MEDALPQLMGDEILAYVRFLLDWTDAAPRTATGQVHHRLITLGTGDEEDEEKKEEEEEMLSPQTFSYERLPGLVRRISDGIVWGQSRSACSVVIRNAMKHVMSDRCAGKPRGHCTSSMRQGTTVERLLAVARSTQYRGPLVLLTFHPNEAVRIWSRETLLHLVKIAASSSSEPSAAAIHVWLLGMQLLCAIRHLTCVSLDVQEEGTCLLVTDGFCSLLAVLMALDTNLVALERQLLQGTFAAGDKHLVLFCGVSTATIILLGGSMLLYWLLTMKPADNNNTTMEAPESATGINIKTSSVTEELAGMLNAKLGTHTTLQPASLASDTKRALVKILVHCLFESSKHAVTSSREDELWYKGRMRNLWCLASHIDPPSPTNSTKKQSAGGTLSSPPAKSAGWMLRFLMRNASVQLNMQTALRGVRGEAQDDVTIYTMETAVHALRWLLTALAETLPELATSHYYHEFLLSIQEDCVKLTMAVAMRTQQPQVTLMLLRHLLLTDIVLFGRGGQPPQPGDCLRRAWETIPTLLRRSVIRQGGKTASNSPCSPSLLLRVIEVLDITMEQSSACAWLHLKSLKDGPQPLALVLSKCIQRITEIMEESMEEMRHQWEEAVMMGGNGNVVSGSGLNLNYNNNSFSSNNNNYFYYHNNHDNTNTSYQGNTSSAAASRLLSSGSSIPRLAHVFMISKDHVTRRLGEVLSSLFLRSFSLLAQDTFRADAANWLLKVILNDPVLQENMLKLHDAKVDSTVRENGATWVPVMCSCNWSNLPTEILTMSWWLCALVTDVCVLEMSLWDRLLDLVVTQLPPLTTEKQMLICSANSTTSSAVTVAEIPASGDEANFSQIQNSLRQCAQHLLLVLVQKCSFYSATVFARAVLHVAAMSFPPTRTPSDKCFKSALLKAFLRVLPKLPAEAKDMLTEYAPAWLAEILCSAQRSIEDSMAKQNRSLQQYEVEEKQIMQLEEENRARARQEEVICRSNRERRLKELADERDQATHNAPCVAQMKSAVRRPRDELASLMVAQTGPCSREGGLLQQQQQATPQLRLEGKDDASLLVSQRQASPPPTALQRHLQKLGEKRVNELFRVENLNKNLEAIRRIAGNTDFLQRPPNTDDIIGYGRHCLAVDVPVIPYHFSATSNAACDLYVASFLPHIALELRYELHQKFDEILESCRMREFGKKRRRDHPTTLSAMRARAVDSTINCLPAPSLWTTENGLSVVCTGDVTLNPLDPTCMQFSVVLQSTPSMTTVASLSAGLSEGDVAVLLLPLRHIFTSLPRLFHDNACSIPEAWRVLGCVPKICLVSSLQPGARTALLTAFTSATKTASSFSSSSSAVAASLGVGGENEVGTISLNFSHVIRAFASSQTHFYIKRLSSIGPSLATVNALHDIQRKMFASTLLEPHREAKISRMYYHAIEREIVLSERWEKVSLALVLQHCLNEWQKRAIMAVLFAFAPGWEATALGKPLPLSLLPRPPDLFIIEGPPGTGKTQTIAALTLNLLHYLPRTARRVLVCAPSNCAVDELLLRLRGTAKRVPQLGDLQLLRVGVRDSVDREVLESLPPLFFDDCVKALVDVSNTSHSISAGRMMRNGSGDVLKNSNRQNIRDHVLFGAHVVCSTLGSLSQLQRADFLFDVVIVDEASQGTEPDVLQALMLAKKRAVLVGDFRQLQPTVLCQVAAARGLKRSLLQRLLHQGHRSYFLREQYRMHPDICAFPNRYFYGKRLLTHASVMARQRDGSSQALPLPTDMGRVPRFVFVDVQDGLMEWGRGRSLMNRQEAEAVVLQMRRFRAMLQLTPEEFARRTGIITFYQAQKEAILQLLLQEERRSELQVSTVDSFQGKEKDIIFISCVRALHPASRLDGTAALGFLEDWHRINVSLTRAKEFCVLFGHKKTFRAAAAFKRQQRGVEEHSSCKFEIMVDDDKDEDEDVVHEVTPPPPKSDEDPFVLDELVQYVVEASHKTPLDKGASAAIFKNHKNLHVLRELLARSNEDQEL
ncbi:putative ATP-dependent helicase [Trypanosoma cruzi]|nr:putative ATP-dependent helicase [Trypanosoma cruzi]